MRLTLEQFKKLFPNAVHMPDTYNYLSKAMADYGIDTEKRQNYFLAQLAHECVGFRYIHELGSKSYFKRYEGRKDLGNTQAGDGYKYRGRGWIQCTGRHNYTVYGKKLGVDLVNNPDVAGQPEIAAKIAAQYWVDKDLNKYADQGDMKTVTKRINGGYNGYQDRLKWLGKIRAVPTLNTKDINSDIMAKDIKIINLEDLIKDGSVLHYKNKEITIEQLDKI